MEKVNEMDIIGVSDAARLLNVSESSVRYWVKTGRLPALRTPSGHRLFMRADVEALAQTRGARK